MTRIMLLASAAMLAIAPVAAVQAQTSSSAPMTQPHGSQHMTGKDFATKAAVGGMTEVDTGKLALEKSGNAQVKEFADMMVKDHTKANDELKAIAQKKNLALPTDLDAKHKAVKNELQAATGAKFDQQYAKAMVEGHTEMLALMKGYSQSGDDADLKAFAAKTAPTVEHHLAMAKQLQQRLVATGSGN